MDAEPLAAIPEQERTSPDYVVSVPKGAAEQLPDTGNEHVLVFRRKDGTFAAVWTQSGFEGQYNQRIVFAESDASARNWSAPRVIAGGEVRSENRPGYMPLGISAGLPLRTHLRTVQPEHRRLRPVRGRNRSFQGPRLRPLSPRQSF